MSRVDFYFISPQGGQARLLFACRLLEKAYLQQERIYVHFDSAEKARVFDQLLWTYRDESFIPHELAQSDKEAASPIELGYLPKPSTSADILLNMQTTIPAFHGQFKRILEIITAEEAMQTMAEQHRVFYEAQGYTLHSHRIQATPLPATG